MKRLGFFFASLLIACNSGSDGDTDSGNNSGSGGMSSSTGTDPSMSATESESETANSNSASASGSTSGSSTTSDSGVDGSSTEGSSSGVNSSEGSSSTGETGAEQLCEDTGGTWDENACDHYVCGVPNACKAIIPGCDCGPDANFVEGEGCVDDDACETFNCEDEVDCQVGTQYCEVMFPAVKGAPITYNCRAMPKECVDMVDCDCLNDALMLLPPPLCNEPTEDGLIVQVFGV